MNLEYLETLSEQDDMLKPVATAVVAAGSEAREMPERDAKGKKPEPEKKPEPAQPARGVTTKLDRIPIEMYELIDNAAQHYGVTHADILRRDDCPLWAWLVELNEVVVTERRARLNALKKRPGNG